MTSFGALECYSEKMQADKYNNKGDPNEDSELGEEDLFFQGPWT